MVRAWYMDENYQGDQRLEHLTDPPNFVTLDHLRTLGVLYWNFDPSTYETNDEYERLKTERGYTFQDMIEISPECLDNYEAKLKSFFDEHIHSDEEIRFVLDGSGYFDVRDLQDKWIRIELKQGDLIVLPAGIFHRFTLDKNNYIKALRLFVGEPVWTPYSRSMLNSETNEAVQRYKQMLKRSCINSNVPLASA